jgi:hypothetical protein
MGDGAPGEQVRAFVGVLLLCLCARCRSAGGRWLKAGDAKVFYSEFTREAARGSWDGVGGRILVTRLRDQGFDFSFRVEFAPTFNAALGGFVTVGGATIRSLPGFNGTAR